MIYSWTNVILAISRNNDLPLAEMSTSDLHPRFLTPRLLEALADTPVVLIHGPRQAGKTTLARTVGEDRGHVYFTFDDIVTLEAARADPVGFVDDLPPRVILDEVQRVPRLFSSLKRAVDRDRSPGRFILTGSANVLFLPTLSDSMAGRMEILRLFPLSQGELAADDPGFLDRLFAADFTTGSHERLKEELADRIVAGGYPDPLARTSRRRRAAWYRDCIETLVQQDVREMARITSADALPRLLALAAGQTARLLNVTELAGPFSLSRPTIREYVTLLERIFLLEELPPWHTSRLNRLVKTPKLHVTDTGLASNLLACDAPALYRDRASMGHMLETFVFNELRRQGSWWEEPVRFYHFRDKDGYEVDVVLERGGSEIAGVEVKAAASLTASDFRGLRKLKNAAGDRFVVGVVLYDGETCAGFGDGLFAVPVRMLWETG